MNRHFEEEGQILGKIFEIELEIFNRTLVFAVRLRIRARSRLRNPTGCCIYHVRPALGLSELAPTWDQGLAYGTKDRKILNRLVRFVQGAKGTHFRGTEW